MTHLPPQWLAPPAEAVMRDLRKGGPLQGIEVVASRLPDMNGLSLGLAEDGAVSGTLADDLDPNESTEYGGGNWVPRSLTGANLLVLVAELLQEALVETRTAWGESRPRCPHHRHPARPALRGGEAWWICPSTNKQLWRIGEGEVPAT